MGALAGQLGLPCTCWETKHLVNASCSCVCAVPAGGSCALCVTGGVCWGHGRASHPGEGLLAVPPACRAEILDRQSCENSLVPDAARKGVLITALCLLAFGSRG